MRHRIRRVTLGKVPIKHAVTTVGNTGAGVGSYFTLNAIITETGARVTAGGVQVTKDNANTESICNIGDIIKYVNFCIECSPRGANPTQDNDNCAWLEWAVVYQEERDINPTVANIGVATLGTICSHFYRENCLMTGCFPIGTKQAMSTDLKIKIPRKWCRLKIGYVLNLLCYVRTSVSTDVRTDSHRLIASAMYKCYS